MLINEVSKRTKCTKKAIEYYALQGFITPSVLCNGYRDYSEEDVQLLNKISVLRKLDVSIGDIRAILNGLTNLQSVAFKKELKVQRGSMKNEMIQKLIRSKSYEEIGRELETIEQGKNIAEKILDAFPGYYGQFVCLHFSRFLNEPVQSEEQQSAYETILEFLDNVPPMDLPEELEAYLMEGTRNFGMDEMHNMLKNTKRSIENPDEFLADNKEMLEQYLAYKQTDAYKSSPAFRLMELMKEFNSAHGYNDVFIPAMRRLSSSYTEYYRQLEIANEKLLEQYPEIERWSAGGQQ